MALLLIDGKSTKKQIDNFLWYFAAISFVFSPLSLIFLLYISFYIKKKIFFFALYNEIYWFF